MKFMVNLIFFGIVSYALVLAALYFFQDKFIFFPGANPFGNCPEMEKRRALAEISGNIRYYLKTESTPDNWIIIFHGNAGNACDRTYLLDFLKEMPSNIVVFEYPGFGKDANAPGESIILKQALELVRHIKERNQEKLPVFLMGESLGTGVATFVATRTDVSGLILFSAYTSLSQVAQYHYPWAPVKYLMKHKFTADIWAGQVQAPALFFHGLNDDIIPIHLGRQQALNFNGETRLVELPHSGHNDLIDGNENIILVRIKDFISTISF